jgi:predicted nucleic acid-binding protein
MIVLDASGALAIVLASQTTPASEAFFSRPLQELIAPAIFAFEVRNALLRAERRGLTGPDLVDLANERLGALVELRAWSSRSHDLARLVSLARREGLSLFDAAYLELAEHESAAIASRDGPLLEAAERRGVQTHDLR